MLYLTLVPLWKQDAPVWSSEWTQNPQEYHTWGESHGLSWKVLTTTKPMKALEKLEALQIQFAVSEEEETFKCAMSVWLFFLEMEYSVHTSNHLRYFTVAVYDLIHRANAVEQNNNTTIKCKINGKRLSRLVSDSTSDWENKIRMYYTRHNHFLTADPTQLKAWT